MTRALRAWAINRGGKNWVRNLQYGPRTRLVRGVYYDYYDYNYDCYDYYTDIEIENSKGAIY